MPKRHRRIGDLAVLDHGGKCAGREPENFARVTRRGMRAGLSRAAVVGILPRAALLAMGVALAGAGELLVYLVVQGAVERQVADKPHGGASNEEQCEQARDQSAAQRPPSQPSSGSPPGRRWRLRPKRRGPIARLARSGARLVAWGVHRISSLA